MVLLEFAMAPRGPAEGLSDPVSRIIDIIDRSGVPYQLTPMGTILEGEWADVMAVVTACFEALKAEAPRVSINLKADYRAGRTDGLTAKVEAVERKLGRKLRT